jgi:hypothetical protein
MNAKPWKESRSLINFGISDWEPTGEPESREIISEAKRHCPEFPFDPSPETTWIKRLSFYKDYRLVCLRSTSSENWLGSEVYGFYAPGDFRPVDGSGSTVEELNKVAPLILNSETILDYVLLRLRFELRGALDDANKKTQFLPEIVTGLEDLSRGKEKFEERELNDLARFLMSPVVETFPRKRTRKFLITVSAVVYADTGSWRSLRAKAYVSSSGNIPGDSIEVQLGRRYEGLSPRPGKAVLNVLRGRTAINIPEWYILEAAGKEGSNFPEDLVRKIENDPSVWRNTLAEKYGVVENDDVQRVILRIADLKFYKTFCLLEIQKRLSDSYMRSYALIRFHNSKADIRPLTGKSEVLHAVNADDDKPLITAATADEYLRFYCWAVPGEEGPFYIPRYLRELPFKSAPDPNVLVKILKYCSPDTKSFPITDVDNDTASKMEFPADDAAKKKACFFYLTVMSLAHFSIGATGLVSLVADEFISGDLDLEAESYGKGDLFTLVPVNRDEAEPPPGKDRPAPKHYLNAAVRGGRKDQAKPARNPKNSGQGELPDLRQDLLREGLARGLEIHEPVIFNGAYFEVEEERDKTF